MHLSAAALKQTKTALNILVAEDDPDDRLLIREAFEECRIANHIDFVQDGQELLDYLLGQGKYSEPASPPGIILLDLNMPRKDGREVLQELKHHPQLRTLPVIVLTTSKSEEDIAQSYLKGVSGFIVKPVTFKGLVDVLKGVGEYWLEIVELPQRTKV
ncbi:response regulator [Balneatrix alpica]|uniref:Response regulator n=1 Tax=Balneatrix alpica TaxID=75684 RepID=A0ABV5ZEP2_9GAMM|nr:response regulator [Balneatrix alpica]